ncbi:MAG TPA: GMC oxidoreductase [Magnetospirillaceae bacterium]|nr:GMC oxidoreductase [Magnetospirillaceae bacterium]
MKAFDYIVVGSGCSGAMAAQTLVEAGKKVAMVDVGETNPQYGSLVPDKDYLTLRTTDPNQYQYLIGENAEGIVISDAGKGAQVTPGRSNMLRDTDRLIPLRSRTFSSLESLGYGGLGIGWGLQCWEFTRKEIAATGMDVERTVRAYETVSGRIGISGTNDSAARYTLGELMSYQPSPEADRNMRHIYKRYQDHKKEFDTAGVMMGRTPLALITRPKDGRRAYAYRDMDFYDDNGASAWRPWITLNELRKKPNFTYIHGFLALSFRDTKNGAVIKGLNVATKKPVSVTCKKLILATGALGTARIALRSLAQKPRQKIPFLSNPYTYVPCVQPAFFGKGTEARKIGFGQISAFLTEEDERPDTSILTLYSYQSLMLFRVIQQAPLNFIDARTIMRYLSPGLIVTGIQHSDRASPYKYLRLIDNPKTMTGDELEAYYELSAADLADQKRREDTYIKALRKVGLYAVKRMNPGNGSSLHYAGTLPFSETEKPLSLSPTGRVHQTRNIYVADSSGFKFLPARGLTFSILANAHIVAENVLQGKE